MLKLKFHYLHFVPLVLAAAAMILLALSRDQPLLDEVDYWKLAQGFAAHGEFLNESGHPTAYRPPLIPWLLSPLAASGATLVQARMFYCTFGVIAIIGAFLLARHLNLHPAMPLLTAAIGGFYPVFIFTAAAIYPQSLLAACYIWAFYILILEQGNPAGTIFRSAGLATLFAISLLASSSSLFVFLPILVGFVISLKKTSYFFRHVMLAAVTGLTVCLVLIGPYVWRNHEKVHTGFYISLNSGINLLLGNSTDTKANSGVYVTSANQLAQSLKPLGEYEANSRLLSQAIENIKIDPQHYAILYCKKFINGFNNSAATYHDRTATTKTIIAWLAYIVLISGALSGYWLVWKRNCQFIDTRSPKLRLLLAVIAAAYLLNIAGYAIFFTRLRFRVPTDFLLALPAAIGYCTLLLRVLPDRFKSRFLGDDNVHSRLT